MIRSLLLRTKPEVDLTAPGGQAHKLADQIGTIERLKFVTLQTYARIAASHPESTIDWRLDAADDWTVVMFEHQGWERPVEFAPWEPRQYHEVAVYDGRLWVLEGYHRRNRNDVWYSADGVNWYELADTPWKPRHAASVFVQDGALWMVAGNNMESDVWKLRRRHGGQRGR